MAEKQEKLGAGFVAITGGMDSGIPSQLPPEKLSFAINCSMRDGVITQRQAFKNIPLDFGGDAEVEAAFKYGRFQGAAWYQPDNSKESLIASIGGRIFRIQTTGTVTEITPATGRNSSRKLQAWFCQAEKWMIIQDGQSRPIIYNGAIARRSIAAKREIPVGCMMDYGMGRLWVVLPDRKRFIAGDLVYGDSGTIGEGYRDSILRVTESDFLNGGGAFVIPAGGGKINAIRFMANLDTALGSGPLQVLTENTVFSVNAPVRREVWQDLEYPIQSVCNIANGALCQDSTIVANGDLFYRAKDGIRTLKMARRDFSGTWGNTPVSEEIERILGYDNATLLQYGSAVVFSNRFLATVNPVFTQSGIWHRGLAVLDFSPISAMTEQSPPAYDGLWTGIRFLKVLTGTFTGVERAFAFALNPCDEVELWEITNDSTDTLADGTSQRIEWTFETPAYNFESAFSIKELDTAELFYRNLEGNVDFEIQFRPDNSVEWFDWNTWSECATVTQCDHEGCETPLMLQSQYRTRRKMPRPPKVCETSDEKPSNLFYDMQFRITVTGVAEISRVRFSALPRTSETSVTCGAASCRTVDYCPPDPYAYSAHIDCDCTVFRWDCECSEWDGEEQNWDDPRVCPTL